MAFTFPVGDLGSRSALYSSIGDNFVSSDGVGSLESAVYYCTHVKGEENVSCRVEFGLPCRGRALMGCRGHTNTWSLGLRYRGCRQVA